MSDEKQTGALTVGESDRPVRSIVVLICVLGFVWAVGRHVVPFFPSNLPLFMIEPALIVVECAVLLYWVFREWRATKRPPTVADGVKFMLLSTGCAAVLWFLTESYLIFEVAGFSSAAILGMAIVVLLIAYMGRWIARFYWDVKLRLAVLEQLARQQGFDPEQLRREFCVQIPADDPLRRSRTVRSIVGSDFRVSG
jgi:hypothetical protein